MTTFTVNNKEFAVSKDRKLIGKTTFGPQDWGISAWLPVHTSDIVSELPSTSLDLGQFPKIPYDVLLLVREFFAEVYTVHKSEAFVYMHFDKEANKYEIVVPPNQTASAGHVKFDANVRAYCAGCNIGHPSTDIEDCEYCGSTDIRPAFIVGTLHSHGSMNAFHSTTDDANELNMTGFHITIGKVDNRVGFELAHSFVVAQKGFVDSEGKGVRFKAELNVHDLIELPFPQQRHMIQRWVSLVVSTPALSVYPPNRPLLMRGSDIVSMYGDTTTYTKIMTRIPSGGGDNANSTTDLVVVPISELEDYRKGLKTLPTNSDDGSTKSSVTTTVNGVVVTRKKNGKGMTAGTNQPGSDFRKGANSQQTSQAIRKALNFVPPSILKVHQKDLVVSIDAENRLRFARISAAGIEETWYVTLSMLYHGISDDKKGACLRYALDTLDTVVVKCLNGDDNARGVLLSEESSLFESLVNVFDVIPAHVSSYEVKHIINARSVDSLYYTAAHTSFGDKLKDILEKLGIGESVAYNEIRDNKAASIYALLAVCWVIQELVRITELHDIVPNEQLLELITLLQDDLISTLGLLYMNDAKIINSVS